MAEHCWLRMRSTALQQVGVHMCIVWPPQVTTLLSQVEEVGRAELPEGAQLDTLRSNVAKQQQKVDQLSAPAQPAANGTAQVCLPL